MSVKKYHEITGFYIVYNTEYDQFHRLFCCKGTHFRGSSAGRDN